MSAIPRALAVVVAGSVVGVSAPASNAADQGKVNAAVKAGGEFLRRTYASGNSPHATEGPGRTALAGIAMLEAGVKRDDPAMTAVTQAIRAGALNQTKTYHLVLTILFLDLYGEASDVPTIQYLGVRLYAGMSAHGGWGYDCGGGLSPEEQTQLRAALQTQSMTGQRSGEKDQSAPPAQQSPPKGGFPQVPADKKNQNQAEQSAGRLHPEAAKYFEAVRQSLSAGRRGDAGDNSNTQFGLIGLWVAARHGVPAADAFALIEARFLTSQNRADAGWGYTPPGSGPASGSTLAMTCAGLLGLAVGAGRTTPAADRLAKKDEKNPKANDPFYNTAKKDDKKGGLSMPGAPGTIVPGVGPAERLQSMEAALAAIGRTIQATPNGTGLHGHVGLGDEYYMLWSVERVGMAYGLSTIGNADWYEWGVGFLLPAQGQEGAWAGKDGADVGTSFAILFLTRSNFVGDLTRKLQNKVKDPGRTELRAGAAPPGMKNQPNPHSSPVPPDGGRAGEEAKVDPPAAAPTGADAVAAGLVAAAGAEWPAKLAAARETRGGEQTAGLARAIPKLDGDRQKQAREALADRLTRMTAATLRNLLRDNDAELRRAACLACAMKEDKSHVPDLIDRITDPADLVVRAARAGLRSLTGKDFGPAAGADPDLRSKAKADWNRWYLVEGK